MVINDLLAGMRPQVVCKFVLLFSIWPFAA